MRRKFIVGFSWMLFAGAALAADARDEVRPFLERHCVKCHGPEKQKAKLRLDTLDPAALTAETAAKWQAVFDRVTLGEMPPDSEARPDFAAVGRVTEWIAAGLRGAGKFDESAVAKLKLPQHGNRVDHEALFSGRVTTPAASPARVWRMSPFLYRSFLRSVAGIKSDDQASKVAQAFTLASAGGFKDYAALFVVDEPTIGQLMRNAQQLVEIQQTKKIREFQPLFETNRAPTEAEIDTAVARQFQMALMRAPTAEEAAQFRDYARKNFRDAGQISGARNTLATILMLPEALYRFELGTGTPDAHGRLRLAPREIAYAVAFALTDDPPDAALLKAADSGALATAEGVRREALRLLNDARLTRPRVMRFFEEYFEFTAALDVFKDVGRGQWRPEILVADTRRLVQWVLDEDRDVLKQLLTTPKSFVNYRVDMKKGGVPSKEYKKKEPKKDKKTGELIPQPPREPAKELEIHDHYNLPLDWNWVAEQPLTFPANERAGILTQPSWLAGFATNDENHAIRRGKWIRERLLGNIIPDLPITVNAQLPQTPEKTLRQRMEVTREEYCWQCHDKMNPIGLAFEAYDFLGRVRKTETVQDVAATTRNVDKNGRPRGVITHEVPLETAGAITGSGDATIDGSYRDGLEMLRKFADSPRVRQVFVRHAFRFWMGRNEALADSASLIAADRAYIESGGSFKALVASLLSSDSFLYRFAPKETKTASNP